MERIHLKALDFLPDMWVTPDQYRAMNPLLQRRPDGNAVLLQKPDGGVRLMKAPDPLPSAG